MSEPTRKEKADYVRSQGQTRSHHCHWTGCTKQVPPAMYMCKTHWFMLPTYLRNKVWNAYRPGQEITMTPSADYLAITDEVEKWIMENGNG